MTFVDVREPHTHKLLFRFDPARDIIEIQQRGVKTVVDLTQYKAPESAGRLPNEQLLGRCHVVGSREVATGEPEDDQSICCADEENGIR